jgi:hypothetical protein
MVRYKVKESRASENEELVRSVFDELEEVRPAGLHYGVFRSADGVTFVHVASLEPGVGSDSLTNLPAFRRYGADIGDRCEEPPASVDLVEVGSYRFSILDGRA